MAQVSPPKEITSPQEAKCKMDTCYIKMKNVVSKVFRRYGTFLGRHPLPFIVLPIVVFGGLAAGFVTMDSSSDMEEVYFPTNSRAIKDRQVVRDLFPDLSSVSYNSFSQSDETEAVSLLFQSKNGHNITTLKEVEAMVNQVKAINVTSNGRVVTYNDVCARFASQCVIGGDFVFTSAFQTDLAAGAVTYPLWNGQDLSSSIADVTTDATGHLTSAKILLISFNLLKGSEPWQKEFEMLAGHLSSPLFDVNYETPDSLSEELDKGTDGDIYLFSLTITICCVFALIVTTGGNCVSTRSMLAFGGVLAAGLGIVGAMGLLCLCGVKFVSITGVIPFLIIGIGVDDMFLLMSAWSETLGTVDLSVPSRLGETFAIAGIGITITSLTDFLAFIIGTSSVFLSVTNFSLNAAVAVLFCYISNATFFGGCLVYHGRRVYDVRHALTCMKTKSRQELEKDKRSPCFARVCGGSIPTEDRADESLFEKIPRKILPKVILNNIARAAIAVLFVGYLAAAIYGAINLEQGLELRNLVPKDSYYYDYLTVTDQHFPTRVPIGFIINEKIDYLGNDGTKFLELQNEARKDAGISKTFERCWLESYKRSTYYSQSAAQNFVQNVQQFLNENANEIFRPDVIFDSSNSSVRASRCFVLSLPTEKQYDFGDLMVRMRNLADASTLPVFAYSPAFVAFEQYLAVLPATLQLVGIAVAVMTVVCFIFLPHLLMTCLVTLTIIMILVGIFGFMYFWNITLSSITMIHLIMSVGFSVDYSAHVCSAYLLSTSVDRVSRAKDAINHAAGPVLNGGISTLLGVVLLAASKSYIFESFFKIMLLVIIFGMAHAVLFLPVVLSVIGPRNEIPPSRPESKISIQLSNSSRPGSKQESD